ncbi:hypothetical protein [Kerstersia gyiorum]|uniref:hypothetical protein n=1 Tax=Kerstersia gyiorum TaxID=206506 RepID=UPI00102CF708|nr:hypothetical protein [Kerstersia gyiorum]KAB0544510.1 hypothetical protein F7P85_03515 [Kerstersia gyiorum]MCP1636208.1 hypothetical protein [Kerstersia gyiorum]MCP1671224.1 hypothetical protein [Kerstersia gyiorum]MCP1679119.1 hypothetical protein [Kerstersia gyiorum]MCP1709179.1 hypothetical protein [Kerstersia gyiorum]
MGTVAGRLTWQAIESAAANAQTGKMRKGYRRKIAVLLRKNDRSAPNAACPEVILNQPGNPTYPDKKLTSNRKIN